MHGFFIWITTHPHKVLAVCAVVVLAFSVGLLRLTTETDVENMLPEDHPSIEHTDQIEEVFEIADGVTVAVVADGPGGIYTAGRLARIKDLSDRLADVPGVAPETVRSIFAVDDIVADPAGFAVVPLAESVPETPEEIAALRARIEANALVDGALVSADGSGTLLTVDIEPDADKAAIYYAVRALVSGSAGDGLRTYVAGLPVIQGVVAEHVERDMRRMLPLVSLVIVAMLLVIFRSLRGVVLPLAVVGASVVIALGMMGFMGVPIYPLTTIVPVVLMAIGVADGIHITTRYYEGARAYPGMSSKHLTVAAMREMWKPVVMTSLTTAAGFLSLLSSRMKPIYDAGIFTFVGVIAAMVLSLTMIPAALCLMRVPAIRQTRAWWTRSDAIFRWLGFAVFRLRWMILAGSVLAVAASLVGIGSIRVDSNPIANFNADDPIPVADRLMNRLFAGGLVMHVTLESADAKRFIEPDALTAIDRFQRAVEKNPGVGGTFSLADPVKMMNRAMHAGDPAEFRIPDSRNLIGTYLLLYSGDDLGHYVNYARDLTNVQVYLRTSSTDRLGAIRTDVNAAVAEHLAPLRRVTVTVGGMGAVLVDIVRIIVDGQIWAILLSIAGVFVITAWMLRSVVGGAMAVVPISAATCLAFGSMGALGLALEPATAISACIGIGVGVDYAIHFLAKYRVLKEKGFGRRKLCAATMATAGRAIFFNAVVVIGGFAVLLASEFPPSRNMGIMITLNMAGGFLAAVTVLPALLAVIQPRFPVAPPLVRLIPDEAEAATGDD